MKHNSRRLFGAAVVALSLFLIAGSGLALAQDSGPSILSDGDDDSIAQTNVSLSEQDAIDIATAEANGTVEEVELESEDAGPAYEVELVTANGSETEVAVHANDGTVLELETENEEQGEENEMEDEDEENEMEDEDEEGEMEDEYEHGEEEESVAPGNVSLSEQDAIDIATAEANGTVGEVELESEDGTPVYEVELVGANSAETEVTVEANSGTVLETETEEE